MQRYSDNVINQAGVPQAGVTVTVRVTNSSCGTGALATIFSDDGITAIGNTTITDAQGRYGFYVNTGKYDLVFTGNGITAYCRAAVEIDDLLEFKSGDLVPTSTGNWLATGNWTFSGTNTHSGPESFSNGVNFTGTPTFSGTGNTGTLGIGATALAANNAFTGNNTFSGTNTHNGPETFTGNITATAGANKLSAQQFDNVILVDGVVYTGAQALQTAIQACSAFINGCVVDARNPNIGTQTFTTNPFSALTVPITIYTGPYTIQLDATTINLDFPNDFEWIGNHTLLQNSTLNGVFSCINGIECGLLNNRVTVTTGTMTSGQNTVVVANAALARIGSAIGVLGAAGGDVNGQSTTLNNGGNVLAGDTSFIVTSATGFSSGTNMYVLIDSEIIGVTSISTNTFTVTRGRLGTTAAGHTNGAAVKAVPFLLSEITAVSGTTLTLFDSATFTVTGALVEIGASNINITGDMTVDGNYHNRSLTGNPGEGFQGNFMTNSVIGDGIKFQYIGHAGVVLQQNCRYNKIRGQYRHIGRPPNGLGADVFVIGGNQYNNIDTVSHNDGDYMILLDDRSTAYNLAGFGSSNNMVRLGPQQAGSLYTICVGNEGYSSNNSVKLVNCVVGASGANIGIQVTGSGQWPAATPVPSNNTFQFQSISASGGNTVQTTAYGAAAASNNVFIGGVQVAGTASLVSSGDVLLLPSPTGWGANTGTLTGRAFNWQMTRSGGVAGFPDITGNGSGALLLGDTNGVKVDVGNLMPSAVNVNDLGSTALPWRNLWLGTAATNNFKLQPAATAAARTISIPDPLGNTSLPLTIASGTKALNTASVTTATCDGGAAATATGTLSTDTVDWSFNAAPTATNKYGAFLVVYAVPSANTVTFYTCNPSATTSTPTAMTVNWSVRRP